MLDIEKILLEWQSDSVINDNKLDQTSVNTAKLHAKYLQWLSLAKLQLKKAQINQKSLLKDKWLYYNGKMSEENLVKHGWKPDPFDGLKILKGELEYWYNADPDIQKTEERIHYYKELISVLTDIIDSLKWRHQTVKNIISWKQFESGN